MRREIIIAIFALVTGIAAIWGFKYLSGQNLLSGDKTYFTIVSNAKQINTATPVLINGFQVGTVNYISPLPEDIKQIKIGFQVKKSIKLPNYTTVEVRNEGALGGKELELIFDKYCDGSNCAKEGAVLEGSLVGLLGSILSEDELSPHITAVTESIDKTLGNLGREDSDAALDKTIRNLSITMENMAATTSKFSTLMARSSKDLETSLKNMASLTDALSQNTSKLSSVLNNVNTMTADLAKVKLSETVTKSNETIDQANGSLAALETTMKDADKMILELNKSLTAINNEEGSIGKLLKDKELYNNLESSTNNLNLLLQDLRLNPRRYFKIFGKKVPDYEYPQADPAAGN